VVRSRPVPVRDRRGATPEAGQSAAGVEDVIAYVGHLTAHPLNRHEGGVQLACVRAAA
jgi:hypothetical protein